MFNPWFFPLYPYLLHLFIPLSPQTKNSAFPSLCHTLRNKMTSRRESVQKSRSRRTKQASAPVACVIPGCKIQQEPDRFPESSRNGDHCSNCTKRVHYACMHEILGYNPSVDDKKYCLDCYRQEFPEKSLPYAFTAEVQVISESPPRPARSRNSPENSPSPSNPAPNAHIDDEVPEVVNDGAIPERGAPSNPPPT